MARLTILREDYMLETREGDAASLSQGSWMKRLRDIAIISTSTTALVLFVSANAGLALPPVASNGVRPPCFPMFELTFTGYTFRLPLSIWAIFPYVFVLSALVAVTT